MLSIYQGSILDVQVDCIVNPANSFLRHDGGLAAIIAAAAAGPESRQDDPFRPSESHYAWHNEQKAHPLIATGDAGWTSAGALEFKGIVHAVGPIWAGGRVCERDLLRKAHYNAVRVAHQHGCKSIAFPAISCGLFGFPVTEAAPNAVAACRSAAAVYDLDVTFALFEPEHVHAYTQAIAGTI